MPNICLILIMAGKSLIPIAAPFSDQTSCEMGGASMTDGQTVRGYVCVPVGIYDCRASQEAPPVPKYQKRME